MRTLLLLLFLSLASVAPALAQQSATGGVLERAAAEAEAQRAGGADESQVLNRLFEGALGVRASTTGDVLGGGLGQLQQLQREENVGLVAQLGQGNAASIDQVGLGNVAVAYQEGDRNEVVLSQLGDGNLLGVSLLGNGNAIDVTQEGNNNGYFLGFIGESLTHSVLQQGDNIRAVQVGVGTLPFTIEQRGNDMDITVEHNPTIQR
jgi:hypothetical protein